MNQVTSIIRNEPTSAEELEVQIVVDKGPYFLFGYQEVFFLAEKLTEIIKQTPPPTGAA